MSNIYDLIQQKANNHEDPVPPDAWENIKKKKRKKRPGFFWILSCMLLFGLLIGGYLYFNRDTDADNKNVAGIKDQLPAQPNNINDNNQKISAAPVQSANQPITKATGTAAGDAGINSNNSQDIYNTPADKNKQASGVIRTNKQKATIDISYGSPVAGEPNQDQAKTAFRKKTVKKDKARSSINISQGETEELTKTKDSKKDNKATVPVVTAGEHNDAVTEKTEITATVSEPLPTEKNVSTEPAKQKAVATTMNENKKQDEAAKKSGNKHPWFIDFTITPVVPIQQHDEEINFTRTLLQNGSRADFTGKLESSHIDPSVAFSISAGKDINKKFSASIGLQYLQLKEHVTVLGTQTNTYYKYVITQVNLDGGPGEMIDTIRLIQHGNRKFSAINSYRFLTIPLSVQYKVIQQQPWSLAITAGVNINVYSRYNNAINLNPDALLVNTSQTIPSTTGVSYSLAAGARIERMINKQFSVFGSPSFSYMMGKQPIKNSLFNTKIHQFGIGLGLSWKLP